MPNNIQNPPVIAPQIRNGNQLVQRRDQVRIFAQPTVTTNINPQQASIIVPDIDPSNINLQTENENQLTQRIVEEEDRTEPLHIHHPNPIPSIDTIINQLPNRRVEEEEDQTLTFDPISTISGQERPNPLPTFNLLEEPNFYSSDASLQIGNRNQFSERESEVPYFYGLSIPPLQQYRLFDDSSLTNTNDQEEEDPIMRSHNNISSRPQRLLDFDDPLAPSNFQPQHRLFYMSLDIDPSSTNTENQEEDSSKRSFPSLFDNKNPFRHKRFDDSDDFL